MAVKIFNLKALAQELGVSYESLRHVLVRYKKGEIKEYKGYKFFGEANKVWYAYPSDSEIEFITKEFDAGPDR